MKIAIGSVAAVLMLAGVIAVSRQTPMIANSTTSKVSIQARDTEGMRALDRDDVDKMLRDWTPGPRLAGQEMMSKYGAPQEATAQRLVWHNAGPFKRILLTREELPHQFPITHMDYLEHTISYNVPNDKTDEVHALDASITIYRVAGELSARCDLESNNVLTLNLANDVATGKKTVAAARDEFGKAVIARTMGNPPPSTMALQFQPMSAMAAADPEKTTLPNTSQRAESTKMALTGNSGGTKVNRDAEILALVIALDENEVHAAMDAEHKKDADRTMNLARMLHQEHGKHIAETEQVGAKIGLTPLETAAVDDLHNKGAEKLAAILPLTGDEFEAAFIDMMIAGHRDALKMLDQWIGEVSNASVKQHLTETRAHVDRHLKQAEQQKDRK